MRSLSIGSRRLLVSAFACGLCLIRTADSVASYTFKSLGQFSVANGELLGGGLAFDQTGDLFGVAAYGGGTSIYDPGTLFEIPAQSSTVNIYFPFDGSANGGRPNSLISDTHGNLYGTTTYGGANDLGTIFKIPSGTHTITTLASITSSQGTSSGGLATDGTGNLWGTGSANVLFELPGNGNSITNVAPVASDPIAVTFDRLGNLFGDTYLGNGSVYEVPTGSNQPSTIASFGGTAGTGTAGNLVVDSAGDIYGTNVYGGAGGSGTVFELTGAAHTVKILASFNSTNGGYPNDLLLDSHGDLFGTTAQGGIAGTGSSSVGYGTVFEIPAGSSTLTTLHFFDNTDGEGPGSLAMDGAGNLYGETVQGGPGGYGTVFELVTSTPIPEPASIATVVIVAAIAPRRRRRTR